MPTISQLIRHGRKVRKGKTKVFRGNLGSQSNSKRAIVTLEEGHRIDVTTGL